MEDKCTILNGIFKFSLIYKRFHIVDSINLKTIAS
jgi:hypothetical protein